MFLTLPLSADLAHLRDAAKSLEKRTASGEPEALAFVEFHRGASAWRWPWSIISMTLSRR